MVTVRFCHANELSKLQKFIDEKWRKGHRLGWDKELLRWQHLNISANILHFVIAIDDELNEVVAILGFIPLSQYDPALEPQKNVWLAIWKTDEKNIKSKGIGLQLLEYLTEHYKPNSIGAIGINGRVKKIYQALKYKTGTLQQYYYLNPDVSDFQIASLAATRGHPVPTEDQHIQIRSIKDLVSVKGFLTHYSPSKSVCYCIKRYANHPHYQYLFYGIYQYDSLETIWVVRKIKVEDSSCLRIVDIIGNITLRVSLSSQMNVLLRANAAEYIDCLNAGIDELIFAAQGFTKRSDEVVIPNYFEPFEQRNIDIQFAYKTSRNEYIIFKGDSDQDRPN